MTIENKVYTGTDIEFIAYQLPDRPEPRKVLMCTPEFFNIKEVKNIYMNNKEVNPIIVKRQWLKLKDEYLLLKERGIIEDILFLRGTPDCEDMVFVINHALPWITPKGEKIAVLSRMKHESRQKEIADVKEYYLQMGYNVLELSQTTVFEGMGDTLPHPGKRLLYGGYGHRTTREAYDELATLLQVPIVALKLTDERFYHLEKCFLPVDVDTALVCPDAFTYESFSAIKAMFKQVIRIPPVEASTRFSLTTHIVADKRNKNKTAIMHFGSSFAYEALHALGYDIREVDTSEFIKSGGSVAGLKMMVY